MIISRTPMRISFAGGGSDLSVYYSSGYGSVVSTAINKYIYITVNKKFDDLIRVSYSKTEMVETVDEIEHNIIREALKIVGIQRGVEVVYMGDVPLGSTGIGLGSSSSLAVGVLNALYAYKGQHVSAERLAQEACEIEINRLGYPIGKQDQYSAAYGGFNLIRFNNDESVFVDPIICSRDAKQKLNNNLLLFYTGLTRFSSDILGKQKKNIDTNRKYLDRLVAMSESMYKSLCGNNYAVVGDLLHEGWQQKKKLVDTISNSEIDGYYQRARDAGAIGGKIVGAGGGGFLMLYCRDKDKPKVRRALSDMKEVEFEFAPQGSKIIYISD